MKIIKSAVFVWVITTLAAFTIKDQKITIKGGEFKKWALTPPIDPQVVKDQDDMTRMDYHPIPGKNWADPSLKPARQIKIALVAIDFPDQLFVVTLPRQSDPFGNPQIDPGAGWG
jgi:hypothetical protein